MAVGGDREKRKLGGTIFLVSRATSLVAQVLIFVCECARADRGEKQLYMNLKLILTNARFLVSLLS